METYKKRYISITDGLKAYGVRSSSQLSERCMCRVHEHLREVNEKAYVPEVVGIGPYHCGEGSLEWMEKQKFRYLDSLLRDAYNKVSLNTFKDSILDVMPELLEFYDVQVNEEHLVEMFVLDGCFIIELVRKFNQPELRREHDPIFKMDWVLSSLQRDLILFENQIPFRVLCKLFDLIEAPNQHNRLIYFLFKFFCGLFPGPVYGQRINEISAPRIKHLLELVHVMWLPPLEVLSSPPRSPSPRVEPIRDTPIKKVSRRRFHSATDLRENGVRFKRLEKASQFKIKFSRGSGVLWVPPITIEERTESFLRNLIAYEQYCDTENLVTAYIKFLDFLIDSPEDVEVLSKYGVIENWLGDSHQVHQMFKKINNFVTIRNVTYPYGELYETVNAYCSTSFRGRIARMRRSLFRGSLALVWFTLVFTLLFSLLITTTMQTVYTARSDQAG